MRVAYLKIKQKGATLILMAFIIALATTVYLLKAYDPERLRLEQEKKTMQTLNDAKQALIAWSVTHQYAPGQMPWPDRKEATNPNYDGSSDCVATAFQYNYLLGQLPSMPATSPCLNPKTGLIMYAGLSTFPGLGRDFRDAQGNSLWYAVSRNLVRDYESAQDPVINSGMINAPHVNTPYSRLGGTNSYPWLQVLDRNGNPISNRVAVVLISPGAPIAGQDRSGIANPNHYLDEFRIGSNTYKNYDYALVNEDFVMGDDSLKVSSDDPAFTRPYNFNDKLIYITIDELMAALEKRVGEQVRTSLKKYKDANGYYPYAAQLGTTANLSCWQNDIATDGLKEGLIPANYQSCTYNRTPPNSSSLACINTIFNPATSLGITQIRFTRSGGSAFSTQSGACVRTNNTCTCTGVGRCSNATNSPRVNCTNLGCTVTGTGSLGTFITDGDKFTFSSGGCAKTVFPYPNPVNSCATNNAQITCSGANGTLASCGDVGLDNWLPTWFNQNQWGSFVYYRMTVPRLTPASPLSELIVGNKNAEAVIVTVGRSIDSAPFALSKAPLSEMQIRPSCNTLNNYLDSVENTNGDTVYDATSTQRSNTYNDQSFIVGP